MKNFHLPLPEQTYSQLRAEADRTHIPATSIARDAIDDWLRRQKRKARDDEIAAFASEMAGTEFDLDPEFEAAGVEHWLKSSSESK
jgi:hypothetical protein